MKKKIIALLLFTTLLQAECCFLPEFRVSYYRPSSSVFRKIYGSLVGYEVQATYFFSSCYWFIDHLAIFGDVEFLHGDGRSIGAHNRTSIWMVPVTVGFKFVQPFTDCMTGYIGAGPRFFFVETDDCSPFVQKIINEEGVGGMVEAGVYYQFLKGLTLDFFVGYSFRKLTHHAKPPLEGHTVEVGGLSLGGGLGYCF